MVFSSFVFVLLFLPITLIGFYLLSRSKSKNAPYLFLLLASLFFYSYNEPKYLFLILFSILVNYGTAFAIQKAKDSSKDHFRRIFLIFGILFNILLLGYYKYFDFFIQNINLLSGSEYALKNIILPLGISFFTFQQLSYLLSVYRGEEHVDDLLTYCLFVSFFPQLVAGPIALYGEIAPQIRSRTRNQFDFDRFASAVYIFVIGLFKKAVVADTFALFVNNGFGTEGLGWLSAWCVSLSYTLQIYFDFSGYSDMAVGLGRMFNFELPFNFLSPYRSESIREFWKRWHITLGRALSTYIYIPLGGNRKGTARTCINLFLTFLVSGIWHGAAWTFVLWGALNGLLAVIERVFSTILKKIPKALRVAGTFITVNLLWVLFRAESFDQAFTQYREMFDFGNIQIQNLDILAYNGVINYPNFIDLCYIIGVIALGLAVVFFCKNSKEKLTRFQPTIYHSITTAVMFCLVLVCLSRESFFIYFNF